jgi:hypothetical protein
MALFDRRSQITKIAVDDEQEQAIARGSDVGSGGGKHGEFAKKLRGRRSQIAVNNANEVNLPMDTAWIETKPTTIPYGARGRNPGGWPEVIPVGVPPAVAGEPRRLQVPKELRIPELPTNSRQYVGIALLANTGDILQDDVAFPIGTIYIDNWSSCWVFVDVVGRWIIPDSIGWVIPTYRSSSQIYVRATAPPGYTQPALTAGGSLNVIVTESVQPFSTGIIIPTGIHP